MGRPFALATFVSRAMSGNKVHPEASVSSGNSISKDLEEVNRENASADVVASESKVPVTEQKEPEKNVSEDPVSVNDIRTLTTDIEVLDIFHHRPIS